MPLSMTFPNVPTESWSLYQQRYPEGFSGTENLWGHFDCYLVRSEGRTILADTGGGSMATNPGTVWNLIGGIDGRLTSRLQEGGASLGDVDTVFLAHLHPDHVGSNLTQGESGRAPTFPNALYIFHQADWEAFQSPKDEEAFGFTFWQETLAPLETAPDWVFSFDMDAALAARTRTHLLERAESEGAVMAICHHTGFGKIVRTEGRRYWQGV